MALLSAIRNRSENALLPPCAIVITRPPTRDANARKTRRANNAAGDGCSTGPRIMTAGSPVAKFHPMSMPYVRSSPIASSLLLSVGQLTALFPSATRYPPSTLAAVADSKPADPTGTRRDSACCRSMSRCRRLLGHAEIAHTWSTCLPSSAARCSISSSLRHSPTGASVDSLLACAAGP